MNLTTQLGSLTREKPIDGTDGKCVSSEQACVHFQESFQYQRVQRAEQSLKS